MEFERKSRLAFPPSNTIATFISEIRRPWIFKIHPAIASGAYTTSRFVSSRERKRFGEIENRDSRGSVGQGCSESLRVIHLFLSYSSVAPTTAERTTWWRKTEKGITTEEEQRNGETGGIYSAAVTLLQIMLPGCATVIAQAGVS